jgi:hypothetical protein
MRYLRRLVRGNIRLIILAVVAGFSFFLAEFWRNDVQTRINDLDANSLAMDGTLLRLGNIDTQLSLGRAIHLPYSASEIAAQIERYLAPDAKFNLQFLLDSTLSTDEKFNRLTRLYGDSGDARQAELNTLGFQLGKSSIRPKDMKPVEDLHYAVPQGFAPQCLASYWPDAPAAVTAAAAAMQPPPLPTNPPNISEQYVYVLDEVQRLNGAQFAFSQAVSDHAIGFQKATPPLAPEKMATSVITTYMRGWIVYSMCIDAITNSYSGLAITFLRNYRLELLEAGRPLAQQQELLRYLTYLVGLATFLTANMKPPAAHADPKAADQPPLVEPDGFPPAAPDKLPLPHDTLAANNGPDRPAGHTEPIIGRPAGL